MSLNESVFVMKRNQFIRKALATFTNDTFLSKHEGKARIIDMFSHCARQLQDDDLFGNKLGRL